MRAVKYIALLVFVVIVSLVVWSLTLPNQIAIQQQTTIYADARHIFYYVGHLERWPKWVYWYRDPYMPVKRLGMNRTETAVGTKLDWMYQGITGTQLVTGYAMDQHLDYEVRWGKRLQHMRCRISLTPNLPLEASVTVKWKCLGTLMDNPFLRLSAIWSRGLIEKNFQKSLFLLKKYAEADFAAHYPNQPKPILPLLRLEPVSG